MELTVDVIKKLGLRYKVMEEALRIMNEKHMDGKKLTKKLADVLKDEMIGKIPYLTKIEYYKDSVHATIIFVFSDGVHDNCEVEYRQGIIIYLKKDKALRFSLIDMDATTRLANIYIKEYKEGLR